MVQETEAKHSLGLLPSCTRPALSNDTRATAKAAQRAIRSWFEVIRHLERCDYSRVRYYSSTENELRVLYRVGRLKYSESVECRDEAAVLERRSSDTFLAVREWVEVSTNLCALDFRADVNKRRSAEMEQRIASLQCKIQTAYPELNKENLNSCGTLRITED